MSLVLGLPQVFIERSDYFVVPFVHAFPVGLSRSLFHSMKRNYADLQRLREHQSLWTPSDFQTARTKTVDRGALDYQRLV